MIGSVFQMGNEVIEIRVSGSSVLFRSSTYGSQFAPIESLWLSRQKVEEQFPDLVGREDWKAEATVRLKDHINTYKTEDKKMDYLINEMKSLGYTLMATQKQGGRLVKR